NRFYVLPSELLCKGADYFIYVCCQLVRIHLLRAYCAVYGWQILALASYVYRLADISDKCSEIRAYSWLWHLVPWTEELAESLCYLRHERWLWKKLLVKKLCHL